MVGRNHLYVIWGIFGMLASATLIGPTVASVAGLCLFLLGVPHGAVERNADLDMRREQVSTRYAAAYVTVAILAVGVWIAAPVVLLLAFLVLSGSHFAQSDTRLRMAGVWAVLGTGLVYPNTTLGIFEAMTSTEWSWVSPRLYRWVAGLTASLLLLEAYRRRQLPYAAMLIGVYVILPPIAAVAFYYFAIHSLAEYVTNREHLSHDEGWLQALSRYATPAVIGAAMMIGIGLSLPSAVPFAVGLALAFAVPHMLPIEAWLRRLGRKRAAASHFSGATSSSTPEV